MPYNAARAILLLLRTTSPLNRTKGPEARRQNNITIHTLFNRFNDLKVTSARASA